MRLRPIIAAVAGTAVALVGMAAPASAIVSPYDTVTASSMNNLVTAMESYALFDGNDLHTGVTAASLSDWGWTPGPSTAVQITIEGDGQSWHAIGQDTHTGTASTPTPRPSRSMASALVGSRSPVRNRWSCRPRPA